MPNPTRHKNILSKALNTYVADICYIRTLSATYQGLAIIPSRSAARELTKHGLTVEDCKEILENGYSPRKRGKNTIEKWMDVGSKTYNVVIVESYNYQRKEEIYLIKHVGRFGKKRMKK